MCSVARRSQNGSQKTEEGVGGGMEKGEDVVIIDSSYMHTREAISPS